MSHYVIGVLLEDGGKTLHEMLAPFEEEVGPDNPYAVFVDITDKRRKSYETGTVTKVKNREGILIDTYNEIFRVSGRGIGFHTHRVPDDGNYEVIEVPFKDLYPTFDKYMAEYVEANKCEKTGRYGYWHNPNARWDWYDIGGRWKDNLLTRDGSKCDSAKLKDIDWEGMAKATKKRLGAHWDKNRNKDNNPFSGIKEGETRESYLDRYSKFVLYAVITSDGAWNSVGEMGWWGVSSDTEEEKEQWDKKFMERFIDNANPELTLVIVDLHI